jgi:two-component system, OmpR family, response regulator
MKPHCVLVIQDDPACRDALTLLLDGAGYAVTAVDSALGAVTLVRRLRPCVVLLDLALPYRSGASLLAELKASGHTVNIPILIISALPEALTAERRAMAAGVISKPVEPRALLDAVRGACESERRHLSLL